MFKSIKQALEKFFTKNMIIVLIIAVLIWALSCYVDTKQTIKSVMDTMEDGTSGEDKSEATQGAVAPSEPNAVHGYSVQSVANPEELLPKDTNSAWSDGAPPVQGSATNSQLDENSIKLGMQSNVMRNANLSLRSDPPISKADVGPWNQSTIEADSSRLPLEIGH
jgi:hypothetical protein|tara:strand:+ start:5084 stop:5578 length:495 start_codon:yes stop_codon:yes gene_type:complete